MAGAVFGEKRDSGEDVWRAKWMYKVALVGLVYRALEDLDMDFYFSVRGEKMESDVVVVLAS